MLPGRTPTPCGDSSSRAATLNWSISTCAPPRLRCVMRSETENTPNITNEKTVPATVALGLVKRFTIAIKNSTSVINASPIGISLPNNRKFTGTQYSRSPGCVYRITRTAMPCIVKLQITPKAYKLARKVTLPRLARIVRIWKATTMLMMRCDVPNLRCGCRNQSASTPSSETRLSTPFEPTIAVLTAPARIIVPTTTTNAWNASRNANGPTRFMDRPPIRFSRYLLRVPSGMIITAKKDTSEVNNRSEEQTSELQSR